MKYLRNQILLLSVLLLFSVTSLWAATNERSYKQIRESYIALLGSSQAQRQRHNWLKVIARLETFSASVQAGSRKDDAEFLLGRTWQGLSRASGRSDDARKAIRVYEALAKKFPGSNLADDALIFAAEIALETFSDQSAVYNYYLQVTTDLPPGDMLAEAQSRLKRLATVSPTLSAPARQAKQPAAKSGQLTKIRIWSSPEYTRIVLDLSSRVDFDPHQLKGEEPRIYVDLRETQLSRNIREKQQVKDGIVSQIRSSNLDHSRVRVVLDLTTEGEYQAFRLENPDRVVIDVRKPTDSSRKTAEAKSRSAAGQDSIAGILNEVPKSSPPLLHVPQHNESDGINLIVVDAGHGGKDPGAVGHNNTREKDVTLQMARKLAVALRKGLGCKVLLTRSDDRFLPLKSRTAYANKVGADLFISLHANASTNRKAYGLETYYLNLSKNNQAAEVAARENGTSLEEVSNLEAILFDLMANAKINESSRLAAEIQQAMVRHLKPRFSRIKDLGVRQGPFHVLLGATMPSVLVEAAFISNRREEKRLKTGIYQEKVAQAIVRGIKQYSATVERVARK